LYLVCRFWDKRAKPTDSTAGKLGDISQLKRTKIATDPALCGALRRFAFLLCFLMRLT
jgi:hypothetical protein